MSFFFGTAGFPLSTPSPGGVFSAVTRIKELSLTALELAFVKGIWMNQKKAREFFHSRPGIRMSVHAPYYVNLNARDSDTLEKSMDRLVQSAEIACEAGIDLVVFHPGYYLDESPVSVMNAIELAINTILPEIRRNAPGVMIRPETTGRKSQFGSLEEICELCRRCHILPCLDFPHVFARTGGNSKEFFRSALKLVSDSCGEESLQKLHLHFSGIEYSSSGEKNHLPLSESEFDYTALLTVLYEMNCSGTIICESPLMEQDALLLKQIYESL